MARSRFLNSIQRLCSTAAEISPLQRNALSEQCIVVDKQDRAIGSASKLACHRVQPDGSLLLHRAFSVFLFNPQGEILLQKRANGKVTFPGHVTNACCSHPLGDFPAEREENAALGVKIAAKRRLNYELGIPLGELDTVDFRYLTRIQYQASDDGVWGEHEIDYILFLQKEVKLDPNPDEVSEVVYVGKEDFGGYLKNLKDPITPWFRLIVKNCLPVWWNNLARLEAFQDHKNIQRF